VTSQDQNPPSGEGTISYWLAQGGNRGITEARERFDQLTSRDLVARSLATLKARGTYDPARHPDPSQYQPLTVAEHLEVLAYGEVLACHYRHPAHVDQAVKAGATWPQIAEAVGSDEAQVWQQYREWADGQHDLYLHYEGKLGMNDAEHAAAIDRVSEPPTAPEVEHEARVMRHLDLVQGGQSREPVP
jgi:hypothetical protein